VTRSGVVPPRAAGCIGFLDSGDGDDADSGDEDVTERTDDEADTGGSIPDGVAALYTFEGNGSTDQSGPRRGATGATRTDACCRTTLNASRGSYATTVAADTLNLDSALSSPGVRFRTESVLDDTYGGRQGAVRIRARRRRVAPRRRGPGHR